MANSKHLTRLAGEGQDSGGGGNQNEGEGDSSLATIQKNKVKRPTRFKVLLHNDDYTTMEFVIHVLKHIFAKTQEEAERVMMKVHTEGVGVCGIYTFEIAESKVAKVVQAAKDNGHPLLCSLEAE